MRKPTTYSNDNTEWEGQESQGYSNRPTLRGYDQNMNLPDIKDMGFAGLGIMKMTDYSLAWRTIKNSGDGPTVKCMLYTNIGCISQAPHISRVVTHCG